MLGAMHRIPRYVLLLQVPLPAYLHIYPLSNSEKICNLCISNKELLKYTPSEHVDYPLIQQAITKIREVADHLNKTQKQTDARRKLLDIQASIDGEFLVSVCCVYIASQPYTPICVPWHSTLCGCTIPPHTSANPNHDWL